MLRAAINYLSFVVAGVILLVVAIVIQFLPTASWWFEVRSIRVFDAKEGEPVPMAVDRSINRPFRGQWVTSIRRLENNGWVMYCSVDGATNYSPKASLPDPLYLNWWTSPGCNPIPAGKYILETDWLIKNTGVLPDKEVNVISNIFEVKP